MAKILIAVGFLFSLYIFARINSRARWEILWAMSFGRIKRRNNNLDFAVEAKPVNGYDKPIIGNSGKYDLSAQCIKSCDGGLTCQREVRFTLDQRRAVNCDCLKCSVAKCKNSKKV